MADLSSFAITKRWPAEHPDLLQLYSVPTPNGVKVSIMLEEIGLPYEVHSLKFGAEGTSAPEFLSLNPNGKIPAILDPDGPGGKPLALFESGAILIYLADKTGKLQPKDAAGRYETMQWIFFQMAGIGPMFGQVGFSINSPARISRTSGRATATSPNPNACSAFSKPVSRAALGSWETIIRLPISR